MKVKLLKKVRKRFKITYYPLGSPNPEINKEYKYKLEDSVLGNTDTWAVAKEFIFEVIIYRLRTDYFKYSRKYKKSQNVKF